MHVQNLSAWQHHHDFAVRSEQGRRRTVQVFVITAAVMTIEIAAGVMFGSMALLADGWHMATHVAAFVITLFVYSYADRHRNDPRFTFGTGKASVLGGFASCVALAVVALVMSVESLQRIISPQVIHFNESIIVALAGLAVNIVCAFLLHGHDDHVHEYHDHNLRAAYLHVLADALTSVLAIVALVTCKFSGWFWLDPVMGIVGALVIIRWAYGLLKDTGPILLDQNIDETVRIAITAAIETDSDNRIADLHLWKVGPEDYAAIVSLVTHVPKPVQHYKKLLKDIQQVSHSTIEVYQCPGAPCIGPAQNPA